MSYLSKHIKSFIVHFQQGYYTKPILSQNQARTEMKIISVHQMACEINSTLAKLQLHLTTMPKMVRFPGSDRDILEHIFVDDALGKPFPLPLDPCNKLDVVMQLQWQAQAVPF
jgi:hypothetical protein